MNPNEPKRSSDETMIEELVAYLDGELDEASSERVVQQLDRDPNYRRRLEDLQQAWEMLDELPRAQPADQFARTTIEMVAVSAERELAQSRDRSMRQRTYSLLIGLAVVLAAMLAGFGITRWSIPDPDEELLRDLPVIENLDLYAYADDIEFLRQLQREGLFAEGFGDEN